MISQAASQRCCWALARHAWIAICLLLTAITARARNVPAAPQAYGPDGLGILLVAGVPRLPELRHALLPLAERFAVRRASNAQQLHLQYALGHGAAMMCAKGTPQPFTGALWTHIA